MARDGRTQTAAVQVAIRIRPLTERDRAQPRFANHSESQVLRAHENSVHIVPQAKVYSFDHVFPPSTTQSDIFHTLGDKLVRKFVEGYNVTILAYGQTSSGKTYTMGTAQQTGSYRPEEEGIVPRAASLMFNLLQHQSDTRSASPISSSTSSTTANSPPSLSRAASRMRTPSRRLSPNVQRNSTAIPANNGSSSSSSPPSTSQYRYTVKVSFVEIYNEELIDLLNPAPPGERPPVTIREDPHGQIYWTGVKEQPVHTAEDILTYLQQGTLNRATGATDMNEKSSRSHAILSVTLKQEKWAPSGSKSDSRPGSRLGAQKPAAAASGEDGDWVITTSKFHFVDLAGSERLKRTAAEGDRRKEGININAGLLALGNVISVLGDPTKRGTHVPYRDSKLTRLLQDSLGGNATTLMIACVSPTEHNLSETMNTLQYANRARNIKNKVEKNEVEEWMTTDNIDMLRNLVGSLKNEIKTLKASKPTTSSSSSSSSPPLGGSGMNSEEFDQIYHEQRVLIADLQRQVEELDGEASVTRERNRIVEQELQRLRQNPQRLDGVDFQHFVEPVIEEYEKTISALESQLAMTRAALNHSDIGLEEQQTKIEQYEIVMEDQENRINELQVRLSKLLKREQSNETYIRQLEQKLEYHAQNSSAEEDMLSELRGRILKFKEMDETTEKYISDLEKKLAASDQAKLELREQLRQVQTQKQEVLDELQELRERFEEQETKILNLTVELDKQKKAAESSSATSGQHASSSSSSSTKSEEVGRSRSTTATLLPPDTPSTDIIPSTTDTLHERDVIYNKQIHTLQHDLEKALEEKKQAEMEHEREVARLREALARYESAPPDDKTLDTLAIAGPIQDTTDAHVKQEMLRSLYVEESIRLQHALDRIHEMLQSTRAAGDAVSRKDAVIMRRVSDLDKQLSKQKLKVENDLKAFDELSVSDVMSASSRLEQEIQMLQSVTTKLEAKLHKTEMALATNAKTTSLATNDEEIEELRHRMGAMMLGSEEHALNINPASSYV